MSKRNTSVAPEEIKRQKDFLNKIRVYNATKTEKPKATVITLGCQQNENDSEKIRGMLFEAGYEFCDDTEKSDIVIYNTCAVRENAELKIFGQLGYLKTLKKKNPNLMIGICGCMIQQEGVGEEIRKNYKHVDMIFGTHALHTLPELIWQKINLDKKGFNVENNDGYIVEDIPIQRVGSVKAFVSIMYGCNNFCSYCVVPYVRGRERSRRPENIIKEIRELAEQGYREVMLLGQNVNSYGKDLDESIDFSDLLRMVNDIEGIYRIRFMSSHPKDFTDKLILTMKECRKVCNQLHLPMQSGSNKVLSDMNRRYTREEYLDMVSRARKQIPGLAITSDIIIGFPTETTEDAYQTIDMLEKVRFDSIFSFIYSPRNGTPAASMVPVLGEEDIHNNFNALLDVQNRISGEINAEYPGKNCEVLVEGQSKNDPGLVTGRTECGKIVHFKGTEDLIGKLVNVKITSAKTWFLNGEII